MFNQIFKKSYTINKHINAPLLEERLKYLQYWNECNIALHTLKSIAQYLLRIIDYLQLEIKNLITIDDIEIAANEWARYQYNHPQKRAVFSKKGKKRFVWYAKDWLKKLNRLDLSSEESMPLFNHIFERSDALRRQITEPLLVERLKYLQYLTDSGAVYGGIKEAAQYLLVVIKYLNFYTIRVVSLQEIEKAANDWASSNQRYRGKNGYSKSGKVKFIRYASYWFKFLNCLERPAKKFLPFEGYLYQYIEYMRQEQGLSENTIDHNFRLLSDFFTNIHDKKEQFINITPLIIDEVLAKKFNVDGYSRRTIQSYASTIRSFLRYAENRRWCQSNLADSVKAPRVYAQESLPYSPDWDDIRQILLASKTDNPVDIRDYAILMLLSVYGMRCSEVINLCLEDFDWNNELLYLRRAKRSKPQIFPLSKAVGESILRYLREVRPNKCSLREVFICMLSPYRPVTRTAVYGIVSKRMKPFNLRIQHHGPHALRHACATHLINEGISLKEISDHLGHQNLETTRIYTKVDLTNLRKVAEFDLGDLL